MGKTLAEKILSEKCGQDVQTDDIIIVPVDWVMAQDGTAPLAIQSWKDLGIGKVARPDHTIFFLDHSSPSPRKELAASHVLMRTFAREQKTIISDVGNGICHQVLPEGYV